MCDCCVCKACEPGAPRLPGVPCVGRALSILRAFVWVFPNPRILFKGVILNKEESHKAVQNVISRKVRRDCVTGSVREDKLFCVDGCAGRRVLVTPENMCLTVTKRHQIKNAVRTAMFEYKARGVGGRLKICRDANSGPEPLGAGLTGDASSLPCCCLVAWGLYYTCSVSMCYSQNMETIHPARQSGSLFTELGFPPRCRARGALLSPLSL